MQEIKSNGFNSVRVPENVLTALKSRVSIDDQKYAVNEVPSEELPNVNTLTCIVLKTTFIAQEIATRLYQHAISASSFALAFDELSVACGLPPDSEIANEVNDWTIVAAFIKSHFDLSDNTNDSFDSQIV
jgi:hypothetical protein